MPRGRKPAVSAYERRRWLEDLENAKGVTQIARAAGRDIRVVKRHIEIARQERELGQARRDFLLGRMEQHQDDLLAEVQRLGQVIALFPPHPLEPDDRLKRKVHDALKEHIKRLPLRRMLESYDRAVQECHKVRSRIAEELTEKETEVLRSLSQAVATYPWTPQLVRILEGGGQPSWPSYEDNRDEDGRYRPSWGGYSLTRSAVTAADLPAVLAAHKKLVSASGPYLSLFQEQRRRLGELAASIVDELDVFLVKRLVDGRCQYCPF